MKTLALAVTAACALMAAPAFAHAETTWYADGGYKSINVDELDINLGLAQARLGAQFTPTFEVEASASLGTASETGGDSTVGFGAKGWFTAKDGVRLDWTNYGGSDAWSPPRSASSDLRALLTINARSRPRGGGRFHFGRQRSKTSVTQLQQCALKVGQEAG